MVRERSTPGKFVLQNVTRRIGNEGLSPCPYPGVGPLRQIDLSILRFLNQFFGRVPDFDALVENVAGNDLVKGGLIVALLWWFWSKADAAQAKRRELVIACVVAALAAGLVSRSFALLGIGRLRPFQTPGLGLELPRRPLYELKAASFPSDHATLGFGLVTGLYFISRPVGVALMAYVLVLVGLPRVYLGIHWPSDILGGAALGVGATALASRERVRSLLAAPALRLLAHSPAAFNVAALLVSYGLMTRFDALRSLAGWAVATGRHLLGGGPG
jgi:membrane-associated phospholipid phosphatase